MGLLMGDGNGCRSVLEWDVDICLISGSGGHKANVTTIIFCITGLKDVQLLFYSPCRTKCAPMFVSSVVVNAYM